MAPPEVISVAPAELSIDQLSSGSEFIRGRRLIEILPDSSSSFGSINKDGTSSGNYRATFNVGSSANEFLDSLNSYFKCELTVRATNATALTNVRVHLDEGGIHSLIKSVTIQTRNGVRIESIDNYNKVYAMLRNSTMSANHVNSVQSMESGDSMSYKPILDPNYLFVDSDTIPSANELLLPADVASFTSIKLFEPARRKYGVVVDGAASASNTSAVSFNLLSDFLSHIKYIPLPMLNQLQIIFEFERPSLGFFITKKLNNGTASLKQILSTDVVDYAISSFRYCANMVEVSENVLSEYTKVYETVGISLPFQSYRTFRYALTGTGGNFEVQFGANSVRYALLGVMANHSFTESDKAKPYHSQSWFLKDTMQSYSFRSGGKVFPANAPVNISAKYGAEAFSQLMIALNQHQNTLQDTSMRVWEWDASNISKISNDTNDSGTPVQDATKFMVGVDLSEINNFSGLNTTGNNLTVELNFSADASLSTYGRNAFVVLCFDSVLTLSKDMGVICRY